MKKQTVAKGIDWIQCLDSSEGWDEVPDRYDHDECVKFPWLDRTCERGTQGCVRTHILDTGKDALIPDKKTRKRMGPDPDTATEEE